MIVRWFILIMLCLFASCYTPRYVHSPAAHNVPQFDKRNDLKIGLYYSSVIGNRNSEGSRVDINRSSGLDMQFAYALRKNLFVQASWYHRKEINDGDYSFINLDSSVIRYKRNLYELGMGYIFKRGNDSRFIYQLSSGIALGEYGFTDQGKDASNAEYNRNFKTRVFKFHLQPAMVYNIKDWLSSIVSSRFSVLSFYRARTDYTNSELNNFKLDSIGYRPVIFWEPAIMNTFKFKKIPGIMLEIQAGLCLLSSKNFVDTRPFNLSAGLVVDPRKLIAGRKSATKTNAAQISVNQ